MLKEFKEFAVKGNMLDLAIAVIIGGAFGAIIASLVKDIIMPPIGLLLGKLDFSNLFIVMKEGTPSGPYMTIDQAAKAGAVTLNYGPFVNTVVNFLIVAVAMFIVVKAINKMKREQPAPAPAEPPRSEVLLEEIRDILKSK
jgi:large conductance mechanosensitive channel